MKKIKKQKPKLKLEFDLNELDEEEKQIVKGYQAGLYTPVPILEKRRKELAEVAKNTLKRLKKKKIEIKI